MATGSLITTDETSGVLAPKPILGYLAMLGTTMLIPIMGVAIKFLTQYGFTTIQMLAWRSWLVLAVLLPFLIFQKYRNELAVADIKAHLLHGALSVTSMSCFYFALRTLPIVTVTSINFITPTIAMGLASLIFRERISPSGWLALILGFVGAITVLKPDIDGISFDVVVVLIGSFLAACTNLTIRRMPARSSNFAVIFYLTLIGLITFTVPGVLSFRLPMDSQWSWILALAITALGVHSLLILAYRLASSMLIGALDYLRIVWALIFGYFIFNETLDFPETLGIVLICSSGLLSLNASLKRKMDKTQTSSSSKEI